MTDSIIFNLQVRIPPERIGNKAKNLHSLAAIRGINVPPTWVIPWHVYQRYERNDESLLDDLMLALQSSLDPSRSYAVRSSSNIEDSSFHSFAGLFFTLLHVQGYENLRDAVVKIWQSTHSDAVHTYLEKKSLAPENILMAVIVQELVPPNYSGVFFNRNPMTGSNEIVIEGVPGDGTALVQDGVTPERWVSRGGVWIAKPEGDHLPSSVVKKVLDESRKILKKVSSPIDLEWVYDGKEVYWVQMREITTLKDLHIYSNRFSKDMMPGMIHPLIWSINVPMINTVWLAILEEIVGTLSIKAEDLAKSFFYRSYFDMGTIGEVFTRVGFPSEGLEMMMGMVPSQDGKPSYKPTLKMIPLIPKFFRFIVDKWRFERKLKADLTPFEEELQKFKIDPNPNVTLREQVVQIDQLFGLVQNIVYFNVITPILASMYTRLMEKQLSKLNIDLLQFDMLADLPELDQYNPNISLLKIREKYDSLMQKEKTQHSSTDNAIEEKDIIFEELREELSQFVQDFGYLSNNSNNFMAVPWRENQDAIFTMIQQFQVNDREKGARVAFEDLPIKGVQNRIMHFLYNRVRKFTLYREQVSKQYVYGDGLFRPYFFRLADGLVNAGWLEKREDIFYLSWDEIQHAIAENDGSNFKAKIMSHKSDMAAFQDVVLPDIIYGDAPPPIFSGSFERLFGTPTSQGYYSGQIKIVYGLEDFKKVLSGDVIVIPYSDVGWTPLFTRAGAVIAESGGLLSHSSIIAREYQIPAVVSVPNCMRLKDFQKVSVNGFTGEIVMLENDPAEAC